MIFFDKGSYEIITFCRVCTILMSMTTFKSLYKQTLVGNLSAFLKGRILDPLH